MTSFYIKHKTEQVKIIRDLTAMHPFVIFANAKEIGQIENAIEESEINPNEVLDLPFENIFMEFNLEHSQINNIGFGITERSPGQYTVWRIVKDDNEVSITWYNHDNLSSEEDIKYYHRYILAVKEMLKSLNRKNTYLAKEKTGRSKAMRKGKKKTYIEIKPLTYVLPKKIYEERPTSLGTNIDWSHKFEVRGHWRKINTIGKNRNGEYCIQGFTWIKEHIRGEGELIKKTRVVK